MNLRSHHVRKTKRRPKNPVKNKAVQRSSKFRWWTASWGVHRGLGLRATHTWIFPVKMFVLVHFTAKSFGKVELNLASTPSLECLRGKLLEESLIWLSTWTILNQSKCYGRGKALENLQPRWFFVIKTKWRPKKNPVKNNFSSLLLLRPKIVKISLVDGLLGCS